MGNSYSEKAQALADVLKRVYHRGYSLDLDVFLQGKMKVLSYIYCEKRKNILPGEISSALDMTGGRIAGILRSLEADGYIRRTTDTADRRRVLVSITRLGEEYMSNATKRLLVLLTELVQTMGEDKAGELIEALGNYASAAQAMKKQRKGS